MMPETTYQMPAATENVDAAGLSPFRIERGDADPDAEHRQQDLDDQGDDDAGEDRAPGDLVEHDGVSVFAHGGLSALDAAWRRARMGQSVMR